jgi:carbon monoxide dehydrogenase subunit G
MKASASILIKKPVAETFAAFCDIPNRKRYLPTIKELKVDSLLVEGKGLKWYEERDVNGITAKGHLEITSFTRPRAFVITTKSEGLIFKTRFNFQYDGENSTKVVVTIGGSPRGILAKIMDNFLSKNSDYMGQQLVSELESYKKVIES